MAHRWIYMGIPLMVLVGVVTIACGGVASSALEATGSGGLTGAMAVGGAGGADAASGTSVAGASDVDVGVVADGGDPGVNLGCGPGSGSGLTHASDPARASAEASAIATLQASVGRFFDGSSAVYRGTLAASDNASVFRGGTDENVPLGAAIADIHPSPGGPAGDGTSLFVYSNDTPEFIQLQQPTADPETTNVYMLLANGSSGGRFGACQNCAPSFASHPASINFSDLNVTYRGDFVSAPLVITASVALQLVSPCSVTFTDMQRLNGAPITPPTANRGVEVTHTSGQYSPPGSSDCHLAIPYTIDLFVNRAEPWIFGIRNYQAGAPITVCPI